MALEWWSTATYNQQFAGKCGTHTHTHTDTHTHTNHRAHFLLHDVYSIASLLQYVQNLLTTQRTNCFLTDTSTQQTCSSDTCSKTFQSQKYPALRGKEESHTPHFEFKHLLQQGMRRDLIYHSTARMKQVLLGGGGGGEVCGILAVFKDSV